MSMDGSEITVDNMISKVVGKASHVLTQEWALLRKEERRMLKWLQKELSDMQEFTQHLQRSDSNRVEYFEDKIRNVAGQAEKAMDSFMKSVKRRRTGFIFDCLVTNSVAKELERMGITDSIQDISDEIMKYQSRPGSLSTLQISRRRRQQSVVGFDGDTQDLKDQLLSDEEPRFIISIVGIAGTGKTTLAKFIVDDDKAVEHRFPCRVRVSVSPTCTVQQLKETITEYAATQIMNGQLDTLETQDKTSVILTTLARTKHLVVFDGVDTPQLLDIVTETMRSIPDMSTASRFLVTSCNAYIVAPLADTRSSVHLLLLDDERSWILFTNNLRVHVDLELEPKLTEVGKKIVAKCGGLPSEILKMSELLSRKEVTEEEWSRVLVAELEQPYQGQNPWSETLNIVNNNLPSYLRRCLFYLKLFPADFEIPVRRLVALWVAEGVVQHGENQETPELVAERYLTELIYLNMLQIAKRKPSGKVKTCRLPNALRQLLLNAVPENSTILQVADCLDENHNWHKHIHGTDYDDLGTNYKDVISFLSFDAREGSRPGQEICNFLNLCISSNCLLLLRVLDLEGVYKPNLPENIATLTELRYLGLRWTYLQSLPSSISTLLKLQTLDIKHTYIHILTSSIWNMQLRHLFLSETYCTTFPPQPEATANSLSDLQTLWGLFVDEETPVKGGLDKLVNITKLGIACQSMLPQDEVMESQLDAVADWIVKLTHLQSLRLKSRDEEGRPWNLHLKSLEDHIHLTDMYLLGCLSSLSPPILSQFPPNLVELTLSHSKLEDDPMQNLKDLPKLRSLSLLAESYMGKKMVCKSHSFPRLYFLKVWNLEQLEEWNIEKESVPSLGKLEMRSCPRMKILPGGLTHVNSLLELKLTNMPTEINTDAHNIPPNCEVRRDNNSHCM